MTTFPALVVQAEYPKEHFSRVVSLVVAINQFTFAFGPGLLGVIRDWSGSYAAALAVCMGCEVVAAIVIVIGRRPEDGPRLPGRSDGFRPAHHIRGP